MTFTPTSAGERQVLRTTCCRTRGSQRLPDDVRTTRAGVPRAHGCLPSPGTCCTHTGERPRVLRFLVVAWEQLTPTEAAAVVGVPPGTGCTTRGPPREVPPT